MQSFEDYATSLPNPFKDKRPAAAMATSADIATSEAEEKQKKGFLNPKTDTEKRVKYVLESLLGADLRKDGDWITVGKGFKTWQRKTSDLIGGVCLPGDPVMRRLYVEVKGCSPGTNFSLARLDSRTKTRPSQHERLSAKHDTGHLVWLAIGWWYAKCGVKSTTEERGSRVYTRWMRDNLYLSIDLIPWNVWTDNVLPDLNRRTFRRKDRHIIKDCEIGKVGNRWTLAKEHWWWHLHHEDIMFAVH